MAENNTDKEALKAAKEAEKAAQKAKKDRIKQSKPKKDGNVFSRAGGGIKKYWKDFIGTVKKIVWPPAGQVLKSSAVVLVTILLIGLVVFGIDQGLQKLYKVSSDAVVEMGKSHSEAAAEAEEASLSQSAADAAGSEENAAETVTEEASGEAEEATTGAADAAETTEAETEAAETTADAAN